MNKPTKEQILSARRAAGLSQAEASGTIYKSLRTWQQWEAGDRGMDPALWELFTIKLGHHAQLSEGLGLKNHPLKPSASQIVSARKSAGLSQSQAAILIYKGLRTWQQWESSDRGMDPALWELFHIKLTQVTA